MRNWIGALFDRERRISKASPLPSGAAPTVAPAATLLRYTPPGPRLGIGITTFNRRAMLKRAVEAVAAHTRAHHLLFVADDGSTDGTASMLSECGITHLAADNRGIAWNKNRALYYLHRIRRCDIVLLLEDDTFPTASGWEEVWVDAVERHGHVNLAPSHWPLNYSGGDGSPARPYLSRQVTGQCVGFGAAALEQAGYMDTRFRRYGFEHVEHTQRLIRSGFGGIAGPAGIDPTVFLISSALAVEGLEKGPDSAGIAHNGPIMRMMEGDPLLRPAWRTDEEGAILRAEMASVSHGPVRDPGPDWLIAASDGVPLRYERASRRLHARNADPESLPVGARVRGRDVRLFVETPDDVRLSWLRLIGRDGEAELIAEPGEATRFELVYAPGPGFALRSDGLFLCCEMAENRRLTHTRSALSLWETFRFAGYLARRTDHASLISERDDEPAIASSGGVV